MNEPDKGLFGVWLIWAWLEGILDGQWAITHEEHPVTAGELSHNVNLVCSEAMGLFGSQIMEGGELVDVQGHIPWVIGVANLLELSVSQGGRCWDLGPS